VRRKVTQPAGDVSRFAGGSRSNGGPNTDGSELMNHRILAAALLVGGAAHAQAAAGAADADGCVVERRERIEVRMHGHPAKGTPIATRVRELRRVCADVARGERQPDAGRA
jgi:hypothetical protein